MTCNFDGCTRPILVKSLGLCKAHYTQHRIGKPLTPLLERKHGAEWILAHVDHAGDDCLEWPFAKYRHGRGHVMFDGKHRETARLMCELRNGPPPRLGMQCAHSCGKGHLGCVNPKHLRWATRAENEHDKIAHGTSNRGARHGLAKLTEAQVAAIREFAMILPNRVAGDLFGVTRRTVDKIVRGETWSHI